MNEMDDEENNMDHKELEDYRLLNYELEKYDTYLIREPESLEKNHVYLMIIDELQIPVVLTNISKFEIENTTTYEFDHIYGDEVRKGKPLPPDYYDFPMKIDITSLYSEDFNEYGKKIYDLDAMYRDYLISMSKLPISRDLLPIIGKYADYNLTNLYFPKREKRSVGGRKKTKRSTKTKCSTKTKRSTKTKPYKR